MIKTVSRVVAPILFTTITVIGIFSLNLLTWVAGLIAFEAGVSVFLLSQKWFYSTIPRSTRYTQPIWKIIAGFYLILLISIPLWGLIGSFALLPAGDEWPKAFCRFTVIILVVASYFRFSLPVYRFCQTIFEPKVPGKYFNAYVPEPDATEPTEPPEIEDLKTTVLKGWKLILVGVLGIVIFSGIIKVNSYADKIVKKAMAHYDDLPKPLKSTVRKLKVNVEALERYPNTARLYSLFVGVLSFGSFGILVRKSWLTQRELEVLASIEDSSEPPLPTD